MKPKFIQETEEKGVRWKCDLDRSVIFETMDERGWEETADDSEWNFYWISVGQIKRLFPPAAKTLLGKKQVANHFQNHYELTRKDLMAKNIRRHQRECGREVITLANGEKLTLGGEIIPATFHLPQEQALFMEEFLKAPGKPWIFKPAGKSQGTGISLVTKVAQARGLPGHISSLRSHMSYVGEHFLISRYVDNPLLLHGRKFDLRLYILVTSYRPLKVWRYKEGFARVCFEQYANSKGEDPNKALFGHLTNVSFQKNSTSYNEIHGGKFPLSALNMYLELNYGRQRTAQLMRDIDAIYLQALKAVQPVIMHDSHCFELYGFDVLIDEALRPWLVEVNASPSLVATTTHDKRMKKKLVADLLDVVMPKGWLEHPDSEGAGTSKEKVVGGFELLYDESRDPQCNKGLRPRSGIRKPLSAQNWRQYRL